MNVSTQSTRDSILAHGYLADFGYLDGVSQPAVTGFSTKTLPGQSMIDPGIILTGRDGDFTTRPAWALDGSFLVFRKLKQLVPEFKQWLLDNSPVATNATAAAKQAGADLLGARMIGRWPSGAPIDLSPTQDDPALGADPQRNNNFDFNHPEIANFDLQSDQSRCPFSAHIRKTRPRADLGNGNTFNQAIRAGIPYGPEVTTSETSSKKTTVDRGLAFGTFKKCFLHRVLLMGALLVMYQSNIGSGFQFQQTAWANNALLVFRAVVLAQVLTTSTASSSARPLPLVAHPSSPALTLSLARLVVPHAPSLALIPGTSRAPSPRPRPWFPTAENTSSLRRSRRCLTNSPLHKSVGNKDRNFSLGDSARVISNGHEHGLLVLNCILQGSLFTVVLT